MYNINQCHHDKKQKKNNFEQAPDYRARVDAIVSRPLIPESIVAYGDAALVDLVDLIDKATDSYNRQPTISFDSASETERAAFDYYSLGDVELILDNIADRADELKDIDSVIDSYETTEGAITPTSGSLGGLAIRGCDGSFERKNRYIPKLKTLLFVLHNDFDVDLHDPQQIKIYKGTIDSGTMKKHCYYSVEAFKLNRSALVCDEVGNTTFVFNREVLKSHGIENSHLIKLTKPQIEDMIASDPTSGRRVTYSKNFVGHLVEAIEDPTNCKRQSRRHDSEVDETLGKYLHPKAPENVLAANGLVRLWGIGDNSIRVSIDDVKDRLGGVGTYRFGPHTALGYTPEQQEIIRQDLEAKCLFKLASEDVMSVAGMMETWGVSRNDIDIAIKENSEQIGQAELYKFHTKMAFGYTPEQQAIIRQAIAEKGVVEQSESHRLSVPDMAENWGLDPKTIRKMILKHSDEIGEAVVTRFNTQKAPGYLHEQVTLIEGFLREKGYFSEEAPEDVSSIFGMAQAWGETHASVRKAVENIKGELGEVKPYKFGVRIVDGFSPQQQTIIKKYLSDKKKK